MVWQVNSSLDYDSESMASLNFQYKATILVIDEGSPAQTSKYNIVKKYYLKFVIPGYWWSNWNLAEF